jgi:hypothetical protein
VSQAFALDGTPCLNSFIALLAVARCHAERHAARSMKVELSEAEVESAVIEAVIPPPLCQQYPLQRHQDKTHPSFGVLETPFSFFSRPKITIERISDLHTIRTNVSFVATPEEGVLTAKPEDLSDLMKEIAT